MARKAAKSAKTKSASGARSRLGRALRPIAKWSAVAAIWSVVVLGGLVVWYAADLPNVEDAVAATRRPSVTVLASDGSTLATSGDYFGRAVTVKELPPALIHAVLAAEDRRFYTHFGLDIFGLGRAVLVNLQAGSFVQGGSTITQQAAKNLFLTPERSIKRKVQELLLALWLEHKFTKDQILSIYLNRVYFGAGAYGVDAAARKFFGRPASQISTYQAAMLAGLLRAPSRYNPIADVNEAAKRADLVLQRMVDVGFIDAQSAAVALKDRDANVRVQSHPQIGRYFVDWVLAQLPSYVDIGDRDVIVKTTLDRRLQRIAEDVTRSFMTGAAARKGKAGQAALVAMTADGSVRAMVGGRDYAESSFNRAVQAFRQPGSAFKPFVYTAGLEAGLTPWSRFVDGPLQVAGWRPSNFSGGYVGEVSLTEALARSINTVAVQVSEYAGRRNVIDVARRLGITSDLAPNPSISLGVSGVSLLEMTGAYTAFASGGMGAWVHGIESITDGEGNLIYKRSGSGPGRVLTRETAAAMTEMMVQVVEKGTGRAARFGRPIAGKTGTSQKFRDGWFIGFSSDYVAGVWMGNDNDRPMRGVTGGGLPAQMWRAFMAKAHAGRPIHGLPSLRLPPPAVVPAQTAGLQQPPPGSTATETHESGFWDRLRNLFSD